MLESISYLTTRRVVFHPVIDAYRVVQGLETDLKLIQKEAQASMLRHYTAQQVDIEKHGALTVETLETQKNYMVAVSRLVTALRRSPELPPQVVAQDCAPLEHAIMAYEHQLLMLGTRIDQETNAPDVG